MPDGSLIASPAGVNQCLSNLSTGFQLIGRIGDCSPLNLSGNPTKSIEVTQYPQGYKQKAFQIGYLEGSAVPMTGNKAFQLVDYSDSTAAATPAGFSRLVLGAGHSHDPALVGELSTRQGLWQGVPYRLLPPSWSTSKLSLALYCSSWVHLASGSLWNRNSQRPKSRSYFPIAPEDVAHSFVHCLVKYLLTSARHGALFPVLSIDLQSSKDAAMSSSAIGKRLKLHLTAANYTLVRVTMHLGEDTSNPMLLLALAPVRLVYRLKLLLILLWSCTKIPSGICLRLTVRRSVFLLP